MNIEGTKSYYIYISSKNRNIDEEIYNFNVSLNTPIILNRNQGINCSVVNFSMINSDYNLKNISFKLDEVDIGTTTYTYNIPNGNYSYLSLMEYLNSVLVGKIKVEYIKHRNCYKFTNLNYINYDYYIRPNNASKFLGLLNDLELTDYGGIQNISKEGSYINLTNYSHIIIKSNSLIFSDCVQDNISSREIGNSSILFMIDKQDYNPFQLITYRNTGVDNYSYNIVNRTISNIQLELYNENNEILTDTADYYLTLKLVIFNKEQVDTQSKFLEDIRFLLMSNMFVDGKNKNLSLD